MLNSRWIKRASSILSVAAIALLWSADASASCKQVFSALSIAGIQNPVHIGTQPPPSVVAGSVALNLQFRDSYEGKYPISGVSLRYTLDDQPISPVLTNSFGWTWDSTTATDGTHVLSVLYVNEPSPNANPCYSFLGREYSVVVENTGVPTTGAQPVPITGATSAATVGPLPPQKADWVMYPGSQPHATVHPYNYQFVPPAGGVAPTGYYSEPLQMQLGGEGETSPSYYALKNGSIVTEGFFLEHNDFDQVSYPYVARQGLYDGGEDDSITSPYATYVPDLDGPGFIGISIDGRLFKLNMDGSTQTMAGWLERRDVTPFYFRDTSIPMSTVESQKETLLGIFDTYFLDPLDLAIDPQNHNHIYVADNLNNRIALVDLSSSPPIISTFAGTVAKAGYQNGPRATALLNQPASLIIAPDETMYIADGGNNVVRKIDPSGNVSTLVGIGYPGSATPEPPPATVAKAPLTYAPRTAVPFSSAYINYPLPIRFDSKGNIVIEEPVTRCVRYIDLNAQTVKTIAQLGTSGDPNQSWVWIDVDSKGNVGTKDDVIIAQSQGSYGSDSVFRTPITGTTQIPPPSAIPDCFQTQLHNGLACHTHDGFAEYPWAVAIDDQEGRFITAGFGSFGVASFHLLQSWDPPFVYNANDFAAGKQIWNTGTVPNFPFGSRPAFAIVHGYEGHSMLGNVMNFDDIVSMTDTQVATYLQNGAEGSVPRPELTGNDLRNVIYFIRRTATGGDTVVPGPNQTDTTPPVISSVSATQSDSTDVSVSWQTDKSTLGFVGWGTTAGAYFGWSQLESGYSTSHTVTVSNLPASQTIHFYIRSKDTPGNQSATSDQTITLH
jgi:hypothetical protein